MANEDLTADEFGAAVAAVTSAFGDPTRRDIYLFVRSSADGAKAAEVAEHFDLHPNVARHHLEKLAGGSYLDVELERHVTAGRPSKRYRAVGRATPISRSRPNATTCSRRCSPVRSSGFPIEEARALAEEVGYDYGRSIAARMEPTEGHRSVKAAVASVADALTAHGFAAHAEARGNLLTLVSEHCPFGEAAQKWPHVLCAVDTGMVRGMLEGLYGETQPQLDRESPRRRPALRHPRLRARPPGDGCARVPRSRIDVRLARRRRSTRCDRSSNRPSAIPGACTREGRATRVASEIAREQVAAFFGARPREVVFTSSGTEAVNTAIAGR